jgi:hypothetical protein
MKIQRARYVLAALVFIGCTASEASYSDRNTMDVARSRCLELARTSGYRDVAVDSIDRDGNSDWRVRLVVRKDGKDRRERCEYNARTNRVHIDD